jgi:nicotinate-nucleotide adenylyltransferase
VSDRVGILGGSFDPPHRAHIAMAHAARERLGLSRVLFMPAPQPPHKSQSDMTPYALRRRMTELAIADDDGLVISTFEEQREGPSFTANMLDDYVRRHGDEVYFVIGADSAADFAAWRDPERILQLSTCRRRNCVVASRVARPSRVMSHARWNSLF